MDVSLRHYTESCYFGGQLRFWASFGGLRDNVRFSSRAHWKALSGLPISVNWTFFARCYGWGATSENRSKIDDFAPTRSVWPKISGNRGSPLPTTFLLRKLGWMIFRMVYKSGQIFLPFCHNARVWQTDGQTELSSLDSVCIPCSAVRWRLQRFVRVECRVVTAEDQNKDCSRSLMTEKCGHPRFTGHTIWTDMEQIDTTLEKTYLKAKDWENW